MGCEVPILCWSDCEESLTSRLKGTGRFRAFLDERTAKSKNNYGSELVEVHLSHMKTTAQRLKSAVRPVHSHPKARIYETGS